MHGKKNTTRSLKSPKRHFDPKLVKLVGDELFQSRWVVLKQGMLIESFLLYLMFEGEKLENDGS